MEYYWISFKADRYAKCRFTTLTYIIKDGIDGYEDRPRTKKDIIKRAKLYLINWYINHGYTTTNTINDVELIFSSKGVKDTKVSAFKCIRKDFVEKGEVNNNENV